MEKLLKYKTFEKIELPPLKAHIPNQDDITPEELNNKIKAIVANVLKMKIHVKLLQDTAEQVFNMVKKQIPPNVDAFLETIEEKDDMLHSLMEDLTNILDTSTALVEIDEMVMTLNNLEEYTEGNMDDILAGLASDSDDDDDDDEGDESDLLDTDEGSEEDIPDDDDMPPLTSKAPKRRNDDSEDQFIKPETTVNQMKACPDCGGSGYEPGGESHDEACLTCKGTGEVVDKKPVEDQLKRKPKPPAEKIEEAKKKSPISEFDKKVRQFVPKEKKESTTDKFKKDDVVYISGAKGEGKVLNGTRCIVIRKTKDTDDCYDLLNPIRAAGKDGANVYGVPEDYLSTQKPSK